MRLGHQTPCSIPAQLPLLGVLLVLPAFGMPGQDDPGSLAAPDTTAMRIYQAACAACHGARGTGQPPSQVAFDVPLPDFTDCSFASREPDSDWFAVVHSGGPARGFSELMPAFGDALSEGEIQLTLDHVRRFCEDDSWPRGELNLPRALVTEKAYPEDELVLTTVVAAEGPGSVVGEFLYEKRLGARSQVELSFSAAYQNVGGEEGWSAVAGDIAIGAKHALFHSLNSGSIVSIGAEIILPTGDETRGLGEGSTVAEPFLAFRQFLPLEMFLHAQALVELPFDRDINDKAGWRAALGRTWSAGRFGRSWTPMIEILGSRELASGGDTNWDILPQLQLTLNTRQHLMANAGVRVPLGHTEERNVEVLVYLLWDWFDGGFLEGW